MREMADLERAKLGHFLFALALSLNLSLPALAHSHAMAPQSEEAIAPAVRELDWALREEPGRGSIYALAQFDNGISLVTRCANNVFSATITGLPETKGLTRTLQVSIGDQDAYDTQWIVGTRSSTAFSRFPVRFARELAKGGQLNLRVPGQNGGPGTRYQLDLPPSVPAVEQTLAACGKSMIDLRYQDLGNETESGLPSGVEWKTPLQVQWPNDAPIASPSYGYASVSCRVRATGRLEDCEVESEFPVKQGFGRAAISAARRAQIASSSPDVPLREGAIIVFNVNLKMN